ncbi:MAG TPA: hypothetical protein VF234_06260 [Limnochordia bacterium]
MNAAPLHRVVLEMSLKPFKSTDEATLRHVCRSALGQWYPLLKEAEQCAILLWISDGSEILSWGGDLDQAIEWGRYIGFANAKARAYTGHTTDPRRVASLYTEQPPVMTYGTIRRIVAAFRAVGEEAFGLKVLVGATFDPGPEFAESAFKFELHPEIMGRGEEAGIGATVWMVRAWSRLSADRRRYAAYPDGIPEGTPFGVFFGRQCQSFLSALGFDYIWFSNGFGFSHFGWSPFGECFDGERFNRVPQRDVAERILGFWRDFRAHCSYPVEVRGTNFTTGIDVASDGVPADEIYAGGFIRTPPPNYPTGALNYDFGLEMAGYLSRIARLPGEVYPFRYYPNDPWFWQNPWWDLYGREPFDIYIPMSTGRIDARGRTEPARIVELLTIDTERGELDERCALEIIPHIRRALADAPDEPGPVVWLYPFGEYHRLSREKPDLSGLPYFGDWFVRDAINHGLPLNTVLETDDLAGAIQSGTLAGSILFTPVPAWEGPAVDALLRHVERGGRVIFYGPLHPAPAPLHRLLNLTLADGIEGECAFHTRLADDVFEAWSGTRRLRHGATLSGGPLEEVIADPRDRWTELLAVARQGAAERAYALYRSDPAWGGGAVGWVRGSASFELHIGRDGGRRSLRPQAPLASWNAGMVARMLLSRFGYSLRQICQTPASKRALVMISRHRNGFFFSGFKPDTTVRLCLKLPGGAPVLVQREGLYTPEGMIYQLDKSFHLECRVLVEQSGSGVISCREMPPFPTGNERRLAITGLSDATLTLYPPLDRWDRVVVESAGTRLEPRGAREEGVLRLAGVSGSVDVHW